MKPEICSLVWISTFTALLWVPYVLNRMQVGGLASTVGYPAEPVPLSPWARRLRAAHANAAENLVVFAALVLAAQAMSVSTPATIFAAALYLWARIIHALAYTLGIAWVRTLAFVAGFGAQMVFALAMLTA